MNQPHGRIVTAVVGLLLATTPAARAQDPGPDEPGLAGPLGDPSGVTTGSLPPPPTAPLRRWSTDHQWKPAGLSVGVVDLASSRDGLLFALDAAGGVWRSPDGLGWRLVLEGMAPNGELDDEDLLLDAESTFQELVDVEQDDEPVPTDDAAEADVAELAEAGVQGADIALVHSGTTLGRAAWSQGGLWVDPLAPRTVMVGRSDGTWVSRDGGGRWTRLNDVRGARTWLPDAATGSLLVGADDGLYRSADGGLSWERVFPGVGSKRVYVLVHTGQVVLAGTEQGLFVSVDGARWRLAEGAAGFAVTDVLVDPNWDGGLWLATSQGLLRTDDLAQTSRPSSRNPMKGVRRLLHLDRPGHLLATGEDGTWESVDGGTTWSPLSNGMSEPSQRDLVQVGGLVLLGAANGAWRLERAPEVEVPPEDAKAVVMAIPRLEDTVDQALQRPGLRTSDMTLGSKVILARFTPNLRATARYEDDWGRSSDYLSSTTVEATRDLWVVDAALCWGRCSSSVGVVYDYAEVDSFAVDPTEYVDLAVIGGEVYDFSNDSSIPAAAANVAGKAVQYRTAVADIVTKAWFRRRELSLQAERVAGLPLPEQIEHHLALQEQDARLDLYTDGWFSRAAAALNATP